MRYNCNPGCHFVSELTAHDLLQSCASPQRNKAGNMVHLTALDLRMRKQIKLDRVEDLYLNYDPRNKRHFYLSTSR